MSPPAKQAGDDDNSSDPSESTCRMPTSQQKIGNAPTTPKNRKTSSGHTPKTAPAASGPGAGGLGVGAGATAANRRRRLSESQRPQPTLLTDFFLGRQSQARIAAQRKKNLDAAAVKAEMRTAMRQSSIMKVQQPGGVKDRVKAWQKANAAAMARGNPESVPSEPTDVAFGVEDKSVTENDRLRIRARQKQQSAKASAPRSDSHKTDDERDGFATKHQMSGEGSRGSLDETDDSLSKSDGDRDNNKPKYHTMKPSKGRMSQEKGAIKIGSPPKKRIVSDEHWKKRRPRTSPNAPGSKTKLGNGSPIPKDFLQRTAQNPTVQSKIQNWAKGVQPPGSATLPPRGDRRRERAQQEEDDAESDITGTTSWRSAPNNGTQTQTQFSSKSDQEQPSKQRSNMNKSDVQEKRQQFEDRTQARSTFPSKSDATTTSTKKKVSSFDDGIRVRPMKLTVSKNRGKANATRPASSADGSNILTQSDLRTRTSSQGSHSVRSHPTVDTRPVGSSVDISQAVTDEEEPELDTPTKKPTRQRGVRSSAESPICERPLSPTETQTESATTRLDSRHRYDKDSEGTGSLTSDDSRENSIADSYGPSTVPPKSLADIPVGYSAFSELDLPSSGNGGKGKNRGTRNPSFKGVPEILKRVVSEGKKMVHEKVDPPRPVMNQPPSIENWLNGTVDPFVDAKPPRKISSTGAKQSTESHWKKDARRRSTSETRKGIEETSSPSPPPLPPKDARRRAKSEEPSTPKLVDKPRVEKPPNTPGSVPATTSPKSQPSALSTPNNNTSPASGLKRSGATRSPASPLKPGSGKKPFRELLRDAFRGESGAHSPLISNSSGHEHDQEHGRYKPMDPRNKYDRLDGRQADRRLSNSSSESDTITALTESIVDSSITRSSDDTSSYVTSSTLSSDLPRRRPPTNGDHELSTIMSVESYSTHPSDTLSTISESTITQSTTLTRGTGDLSRNRSQKSSSGLKRRLTKHSDLVSVLSLPEDSQLPARTRSIRLARSLHRKTSKLDNATLDDLLQEFTEDESTYRRELRTLVSGVIPVLLNEFLSRGGKSKTGNIFDSDPANLRADAMSKAVVEMGVCLEKLSLLHEFVPTNDAARMVEWLEKAYPVYNNYLDVWRLGFQGIIVNLAPAAGKSPEEDSLVNGMERNEEGDVLNENGERVDVAYLLRRPLVRIKWMLKFAKGVNIILGRGVAGDIVRTLDILQEKAHRRNREENARKTDEDARATDTTRARDLRNLAILEGTRIDQSRQVNAKDWFDLSLSHSNGQRLECQVEFIFRDKINDPSDPGDILIRETGGAGRSWLLFPPIYKSQISARKGQDNRSLVVMIRDIYKGQEWYELVTIVADEDETVGDWLAILGSSPMPPPTSSQTTLSARRIEETDVPVGERRFDAESAARESTTPKTPSRYHAQQRRSLSNVLDENNRIPASKSSVKGAQAEIYPPRADSLNNPLREEMRPDASQLKESSAGASHREDGAPPPPAHRTPITKSAPIINPPVDLGLLTPRLRRRMSSPLKHEYHPSDISSDSDSTSQSSGSESDTSSDELEEDDVPDTLPGISIKAPDAGAAGSVISESSLTPSNSASQTGLRGLHASYPSESNLQLMASISYWSNRKGQWKDLGESLSAIVITPGLIEAYVPGTIIPDTQHSPGFTSTSRVDLEPGAPKPLIALDLTPLVMIRQSTVVDLEIRSPVRSFSKYNHLDANIFRFRAQSPPELINLYTAVHQSRMNNAKFKALEEEARFRSFGQPQKNEGNAGDDTSSHRRRGWFGRKNSYRASARAPSQSQGSSSSISATSFLRRLTGVGNAAFNIHGSTIDRQSRAGSGGASFYASSGSSSAGGAISVPRSPSVSLAESSNWGVQAIGPSNIKMRCHLQTSTNKWEDRGNCLLTIAKPPPGVRQELTIYHGLEKRVLVVSIPKKAQEKPLVVVDVVVGSACFSRLAARGIVLNVWEEMRDEQNRVGNATATGAISGRVRKWCFQFSSAALATWVFGLVVSEVQIA